MDEKNHEWQLATYSGQQRGIIFVLPGKAVGTWENLRKGYF